MSFSPVWLIQVFRVMFLTISLQNNFNVFNFSSTNFDAHCWRKSALARNGSQIHFLLFSNLLKTRSYKRHYLKYFPLKCFQQMFMWRKYWMSLGKIQKWHFLQVLIGKFVFSIMSLNICKNKIICIVTWRKGKYTVP